MLQKCFSIYLDKFRYLWYNLLCEGVVSALWRNKSTSWPFGLACFKLRDSCMFAAYMESYLFVRPKYGCAMLGFFII